MNATSNKKNVKESEEYKKLMQDLDDIVKKYEFPLEKKEPVNTEISLERKTFTDVSDEDLKQQAKDLYDKIDKLNLDINPEKVQGFFSKIIAFFKNLFS